LAAIVRVAVSTNALIVVLAIIVGFAGCKLVIKEAIATETRIPLWAVAVYVAITVIIKTKAVDTLLALWAVGVDITGPGIPWNAPAFYIPVRILLIADPVTAAPFCTTWTIATEVATSARRTTSSTTTATTNLNTSVITARVKPIITSSTRTTATIGTRVWSRRLNAESTNAGEPNSTTFLTNTAGRLCSIKEVRASNLGGLYRFAKHFPAVRVPRSSIKRRVLRVCESAVLDPFGIVVHWLESR
jgi:hypothetical protein